MSEVEEPKLDDNNLLDSKPSRPRRRQPRLEFPVAPTAADAPPASPPLMATDDDDDDVDTIIPDNGASWRRGYVPQYRSRAIPERKNLLDPYLATHEKGTSFPGALSGSDNLLAGMFGPASADQLLPKRMRFNNPYVNEQSTALKRLQAVSRPDDDEFALAAAANDFRRPTWAREAHLLGPLMKPRGDAPPLSRKDRRDLAAARKQQQLANQAAFWQDDNATEMYNAQRAVKDWRRLQKERARRNRLVIDRATGNYTTTDPEYLQQEAAMKNLARYLPGTITKPEYADDLRALRGTYVDDNEYRRLGFNPQLSGTAWRALNPAIRKQKLAQFAELIGMFNLKPRRDERLTTVRSAETVYNKNDYDISFQDLDDNPGTPGMVVITTKYEQVDRNGNKIPAGTIVAVDGWVISPQSQAQHLKRLQNMLFYGQHPTKSARQGVNRRLWNAINFGIPSELKPAKQNFKWLADVIKDMLAQGGKYLPGPQKSGTVARETPAVLVLGTTLTESKKQGQEGKLVNGALFRISSPVFNNLISRVAELVFNIAIAPEMYRLTTGEDVNLSSTVQAFRAAFDGSAQMLTANYDDYGQMTDVTQGGQETYKNMSTRCVLLDNQVSLPNIYQFWSISYYHPRALGRFFQDEQFKALFETAVNAFSTCAIRYAIVKIAMHQILLCTMNSNLPSIVDNVVGKAVDERDMREYYATVPFITLLDVNQMNSIRTSINRIPPVSAKNWDNEVRGVYKIALRGEGFVPQNEARNQQLRDLTGAGTTSWAGFIPAGDNKPFTAINFHRDGLAARTG